MKVITVMTVCVLVWIGCRLGVIKLNTKKIKFNIYKKHLNKRELTFT